MAYGTIKDILHEMRLNPLSWCYPEGIPQTQHDNGELRKFADRIEAACGRETQAHKKELETRDAVIQTEVAAREAEREAHKRERGEIKKQAGNAAKLREALVSVKKSIDEMGAASLDGDPEIMLMSLTQVCARLSARIDTALAAPARNCDVIPAEEMRKIFREELPVQLKIATEHEKKIIQLTADGIFDTVFALYQPPKESEAGK